MADQMSGNKNQAGSGSPQGFEKAATTTGNVADQALSVGRDLKDKAIGMAGSSTDAIKDQASEFVDVAKDVASQAADKLKQAVDGQNVIQSGQPGAAFDLEEQANLVIRGGQIIRDRSEI